MKSMDSITADQYLSMLMYHVLPEIKTKWSGNLSSTRIKIQQDNARPHIESSDQEFLCTKFKMCLKVDLVFLSPNSQDLTVNAYCTILSSLDHCGNINFPAKRY